MKEGWVGSVALTGSIRREGCLLGRANCNGRIGAIRRFEYALQRKLLATSDNNTLDPDSGSLEKGAARMPLKLSPE